MQPHERGEDDIRFCPIAPSEMEYPSWAAAGGMHRNTISASLVKAAW